ncbi:hypothetical protein LF41_320 [Lysobacter dokdonensis DS-58]|uniref:Uncharacterized protein n=1 Tax=Lysobacter dokdonensis DS-58 TaxID=1300345 RepID=A0A0A2WJ94_9GAMM|nr:hypothetical protein LF41_320 [Lysobacter dokdonensis DS-58]
MPKGGSWRGRATARLHRNGTPRVRLNWQWVTLAVEVRASRNESKTICTQRTRIAPVNANDQGPDARWPASRVDCVRSNAQFAVSLEYRCTWSWMGKGRCTRNWPAHCAWCRWGPPPGRDCLRRAGSRTNCGSHATRSWPRTNSCASKA